MNMKMNFYPPRKTQCSCGVNVNVSIFFDSDSSAQRSLYHMELLQMAMFKSISISHQQQLVLPNSSNFIYLNCVQRDVRSNYQRAHPFRERLRVSKFL